MDTAPFPHDEFLRFLAREGALDESTIPTGTDRMAWLRNEVGAGRLSTDIDAAKARFLAERTLLTQKTPSRANTDPLIGQVLGGCRIDRLLGQGGMGAVYLATQLSLDRKVAVKVQKEVAIPELVERFRTEAKTLGRLHSPHIVDVYEVGSENGIPWFVMEFMPGGSLTSHVWNLPDKMLPRTDALRFLRESCQGLAEAARHGVLHRDIKPDNLLLDASGTLKIADFGIAKILHEDPGLTQTGFSPGTPVFKSPEQAAGRTLDFRTDMYSLGVSFWTLVTGENPNAVVIRQELFESVRTGGLPWSSPELARVAGDPLLMTICRMMALKLEERFASWQELIDVLDSLALGGEAAALRTLRKGSRGAAASRWVAGAAVLGMGLLGFWLWREVVPGFGGTTPPRGTDTAASTGTAPSQPQEGNARPVDPVPPRSEDTAKADALAEARRQLLLELDQMSTASPRTAGEVKTAMANLTARAESVGLTNDPRFAQAKSRLDEELLAATERDALLACRQLAKFGELAGLRSRAAAIALTGYREDAERHLAQLERDRPRFLRVSDQDHAWLSSWVEWSLDDAETAERGGRFLPNRIRHTSRSPNCVMLLLWSEKQPAVYLDATEVTVGQWSRRQALPADIEGPTAAGYPVRQLDPPAIETFLGDWSLRLPTVAEFAFALETRAGDRCWWGNTAEPPRDFARINLADMARRKENALAPYLPGYDDGVVALAPADDARFRQGRNGAFHHLLGNAAEWIADGSATAVIGGSYMTNSWETFECRYRQPVLGAKKRQDLGFRAARSVPGP